MDTRCNTSSAVAWIGASARGEGPRGPGDGRRKWLFAWEEVSSRAGWILLWPRFSSIPFCPFTPFLSGSMEKLLLLCPLREKLKSKFSLDSLFSRQTKVTKPLREYLPAKNQQINGAVLHFCSKLCPAVNKYLTTCCPCKENRVTLCDRLGTAIFGCAIKPERHGPQMFVV